MINKMAEECKRWNDALKKDKELKKQHPSFFDNVGIGKADIIFDRFGTMKFINRLQKIKPFGYSPIHSSLSIDNEGRSHIIMIKFN